MDPNIPLAASAVAVLAPYLAKAGDEFGKETGKAIASKIGALYQALKTRFENKPTAREALADLEANPGNEDAKAALRLQLRKQMNADPTLVDTLRQLLGEIDQDQGSISFLTQVYGGQVTSIGQIGTTSRLPGDTTTDAPQPGKKTGKGK
jgi:hypothetical protein